MNFGKSINKALADKEVSNTELAKAVGVNRTTISAWKSGEQIPRLQKVEKMAKFFNMEISEFIALGEDK